MSNEKSATEATVKPAIFEARRNTVYAGNVQIVFFVPQSVVIQYEYIFSSCNVEELLRHSTLRPNIKSANIFNMRALA